eukprot:CAMPEP_0170289806 /NCGR_PEP_ID=MMETSP0116_2-20130129/44975_1 /TAXON_ID=400756 /ORGANISM="Durinskia baltica, Strain CSIRO CS-38" /LENGTH=155 /DNA_ID=CAMNT_0010541253 /DNA_START=22 /DNA_END=486 /DNA_ORIENTATION=+
MAGIKLMPQTKLPQQAAHRVWRTIMPYLLAWQVPLEGVVRGLAISSAILWTVDMAAAFFKGFYLHGELVVNQWAIARRYFRRWFFPDLALVLVDWLFIAGEAAGSDSPLRFMKVGKALRLFGLTKLLRVRKVFRLLDYFEGSAFYNTFRVTSTFI